MQPDELNRRLNELDFAFGQRARGWNQQFGRVWDKQLSSLESAITIAADQSSLSSADVLHEQLNELCVRYLSMDDRERSELRRKVGNQKHLLWAFREHIAWAARRIQSPADAQHLHAGLAAASIEDARVDFRDTFMSLGELYIAAFNHGIEPLPYFREVGGLSNSKETPWKAFRSTRHVLEHFADTAFFRADVQPRLLRLS